MRKGTTLKSLQSPAKDPTNNVLFGFRISRTLHHGMKQLAAKRHVKLQTVFTEALEDILNRCEQEKLRYYAPPMKALSIQTTSWISRSLNHKLNKLIERDERSIGAIMETATIAYLEKHAGQNE